jgi:hypothetical protein
MAEVSPRSTEGLLFSRDALIRDISDIVEVEREQPKTTEGGK